MLLVALACALLMTVSSAAMAAAPGNASVAGTWSGRDAYSSMVLTLYDDGYYETVIEQGGQEYDQYGYYSIDATTMYFTPNNGAMAAFTSATEKKRWLRKAARIHRSAMRTAFSTGALSRGLPARAGRITVP
jgi:hypothetical protein